MARATMVSVGVATPLVADRQRHNAATDTEDRPPAQSDSVGGHGVES